MKPPGYRRKSTPSREFVSRTGPLYHQLGNGQIVRVSPVKPWRGKSERRQHLALRRLVRNVPMPDWSQFGAMPLAGSPMFLDDAGSAPETQEVVP